MRQGSGLAVPETRVATPARKVIQRTVNPAQESTAALAAAAAPAPSVRRVAAPANAYFNGQAPQAQQRAVNPVTQRLTVDTVPSGIYGCTGLFDVCGDADLMSLSFQGQDAFMDWLGWEGTDVCRIQKNFITWQRPAYADGSATVGYVSDPCADGNGVDWGTCDFILTDFARLRRVSPTRDLTKTGLRYCEIQPRYRLDGTAITNDDEYDMRIVTEVLSQDLKRMVVNGNNSTPGQFDGLEVLVDDGYHASNGNRCAMMDSIVIDWNANALDGGSGVTWNGAAIASTYDFIDVLLGVFRQIRQRIQWAPALASQQLRIGDIVWVAPAHINQCILDFYTCWRVCPGVAYNESNLNSLEARDFRNSLMGGMFGNGRIYLDGFEIPLLNYDWGLNKGTNRADGYLLTGHVGNMRTLHGQYNDMRTAAGVLPGLYDATDGGRLLSWVDTDNTCYTRTVEMQPRLLSWAPWSNARFIDLKCSQPGPIIGLDPTEDSFFPEDSFISAGN